MTLSVLPLASTIERRLLINYRVDPTVAQSLLPDTLRPQLIDGSAVAGICLLRLGALRPAWMTAKVGWGAENAAHRIAVEWDDETGTHTGVFVPERHSASLVPVLVGGRVFPGVQRHARFAAVESSGRFRIELTSPTTTVSADVELADAWSSSLFDTMDDASAFFQTGSTGWSPTRDGRSLEGLTLATTEWKVAAGRVNSIRSSFFDALPAGSAVLDSVLVMQDVPVTWSSAALPVPRRRMTASARS